MCKNASLRVMKKNRKTWGINPKTRVVPNKKKDVSKWTKKQKNLRDLDEYYL